MIIKANTLQFERYVTDGILALFPFYGHHGENMTRVYMTAQTVEVQASTRRALEIMADVFDKRIQSIRRTAERVTGYHRYHPLFFCPSVVLIPVSCRKAYGRRDGTLAYFNNAHILRVSGTTQGALIYFFQRTEPFCCPMARALSIRSRQVLCEQLCRHYEHLGDNAFIGSRH